MSLVSYTSDVVAQTVLASKPLISYQRTAKEATPATQVHPMHEDHAVTAAAFDSQENTEEKVRTQTTDTSRDSRRLTPRSDLTGESTSTGTLASERSLSPFSSPQKESLTTVGAGLAIVVGLFLLCMTLLRRSGPKPTTPLPKEVATVLGRIPLAARNFAHLVRIGNKLVLVSVTPEGANPIAEVTDPAEVDRLLGLCMRNRKHSTTTEFQHVLQQLANEPARGFLGNEASAFSSGVRR